MLGWFRAEADRASFSKRFSRSCVRRQRLRQHLDRHLARQARVPRPVHLPHPACTERRQDLVGAEPRSGRESHRVAGNSMPGPWHILGALSRGHDEADLPRRPAPAARREPALRPEPERHHGRLGLLRRRAGGREGAEDLLDLGRRRDPSRRARSRGASAALERVKASTGERRPAVDRVAARASLDEAPRRRDASGDLPLARLLRRGRPSGRLRPRRRPVFCSTSRLRASSASRRRPRRSRSPASRPTAAGSRSCAATISGSTTSRRRPRRA